MSASLRKAEKEEQERETGERHRKEKPRWKSRFGSSMAVIDANPRTKRIKDLQEQIHAREYGLGDEEGAKNNGWEERTRKRVRPKTRSPMDSNEDKYL